MGKLAGTGTVSGAIGGAAAVLAIAIFARTGTALEPQRASGATPSAPSAPPSPQTARPAVAPAARPAALVDFEREVQPILSENCLECHSQDKRKGGLSLATYADVLEGGKDGAVVRPGQQRRQPDDPSGHRRRRAADAEGRGAAERRARSRSSARWIDQGARATPTSRAGAAAVGSAARARASGAAGGRLADVERAARSLRRRVSREARRAASRRWSSDALFARRVYLDVWGLLPTPERAARVPRRSQRPTSATRSSRRCSPTTSKYAEHWISFWNDLLRNEDGVTYFSETARPQEHHRLAAASARSRTCRTTSSSRSCSTRRSRAIPRASSIGVNWRGETSAAVTPWMQASQNTAQVFLGVNLKCNACHDSFVSKWKLKDAYAPGGVLLARAEAAAVSLRRRAGRVRRAGVPLSRAERARRRRRRWPIAARPRRRSSPIRATAGCRARSSTASGSGSSATASSPTPTRWTASRGARRCSTGWPATSSSTGTTSST